MRLHSDVIEYARYVKELFGVDVLYSDSDKKLDTHKFDVSVDSAMERIDADALYFFAA